MPSISYTVVDDATLGQLLLATSQQGALLASRYIREPGHSQAMLARLGQLGNVQEDAPALAGLIHALHRYLAGYAGALDVELNLALLTDFQRQVLTKLAATTPFGHVTSYGALASAIGKPTATRAVGHALATNPLCIFLPCHRVLSSSGKLGGYAGGITTKRHLLALEAQAAPGQCPQSLPFAGLDRRGPRLSSWLVQPAQSGI